MPVVKDLTCYPGEDLPIDYSPRDAPVDITGWTIVLFVRREFLTGSVLWTETAVITTAASGLFRVSLQHANTLRRPATYYYDVWRTDTGNNRCLAIGKLEMPNVARFSGPQLSG
jgi:hypothetical protein